jgi:hypothetical protein
MEVRQTYRMYLPAALMLAAACSSLTTDTNSDSSLLAAFETAPYGMSNVSSTFGNSPDQDGWMPSNRPNHGSAMGFLMGGLGADFDGRGFGPRFGDRPAADDADKPTCSFDAATGRVVCEPVTRGGLTILKSFQYKDAAGNVQSAFDRGVTNSINTQISVEGTITHRNGATTEVDHASNRTVAGLAEGSTERTVNGTSHGHDVTTGSNDKGDFVADRLAQDAIQNLVIPITNGHPSFPTAGTITRSMQVTLTYAGSDPLTRTRTEIITFNGDGTATIVITHNGETKTCTFELPRRRLSCQ